MANQSDTIADAITNLQAAQQELVDAISKLADHDRDLNAHPDLRDAIKDIVGNDTLWTNEQIKAFITEQLSKHTVKDFKTAHDGFNDFNDTIQLTLTKLSERITKIENHITGQGDGGEITDLQKAIQAIMEEYAPTLSNLSKAYQLALKNGDSKLATDINNRITETYDEMNKRIVDAIDEFTQHSGSEGTKPLEPQLITSDVMGVSGNQVPFTAKLVTSDETQTVAITFTPTNCSLKYLPDETYTAGKTWRDEDTVENINRKLKTSLVEVGEINGTLTINVNSEDTVVKVTTLK